MADDNAFNLRMQLYQETNELIERSELEHIRRDLHYVGEILDTGDSLLVRNYKVGFISVDKGNVGKSGNGLQHIIEQRFEKDGKSVDEISAMLALVVNAVEDGYVTRNVEILQNEKDIGIYDIEKKGIIAFVSKTRDGNDEKFVITGFDDFSKKAEASDAIKAVIADNSYAPEFVIVKEQVGATLASSFILHLDEIKRNLEKNNLKKAGQEAKKLEPYSNSEELKQSFLQHITIISRKSKPRSCLSSKNSVQRACEGIQRTSQGVRREHQGLQQANSKNKSVER